MNLLLVGNGVMGRRHFERFHERGERFVGVVDSYAEFEKFFSGTRKLDACVIASPASTHEFYVRKILERGLDVFVEKPLALRFDDAKKLIDLAASRRCKLFVAHSERFSPEFARGAPKIREGKLFFTRRNKQTSRGQDVSVLFDLAVHDLDLLFFLCGVEERFSDLQIHKISYDEFSCDFFYGNVETRFDISRIAAVQKREVLFENRSEKIALKKNAADVRPDALDFEHEAFLRFSDLENETRLESALKAVQIAESWETFLKNSK